MPPQNTDHLVMHQNKIGALVTERHIIATMDIVCPDFSVLLVEKAENGTKMCQNA